MLSGSLRVATALNGSLRVSLTFSGALRGSLRVATALSGSLTFSCAQRLSHAQWLSDWHWHSDESVTVHLHVIIC